MLGSTVGGRYRLIRLLGQGGMGAVYEAEHSGTRKKVAVKLIIGPEHSKNPAIVQRFEREARAAGSIDTQHIVQVLDTGTDEATGAPFMVMELLKGEDFQQLLQRCGALPPEVALRLVGQACLGLGKAHEAGVVHRDVKPANLFLSQREDGEIIVKVVDFGVAKIKADVTSSEEVKLTRTGSLLGSPLYMSPEQAVGKKSLDHRTDVWSLGAVLYEALAGRVAHIDAETLGALIICICSEPAPPLEEIAPWVPDDAARIAEDAVVIDMNRRIPSMDAMVTRIRAAVGGSLSVKPGDLVPLSDERRAAAVPRVPRDATTDPAASLSEGPMTRSPEASRASRSSLSSLGTQIMDGPASVSPTSMANGPRSARPSSGEVLAQAAATQLTPGIGTEGEPGAAAASTVSPERTLGASTLGAGGPAANITAAGVEVAPARASRTPMFLAVAALALGGVGAAVFLGGRGGTPPAPTSQVAAAQPPPVSTGPTVTPVSPADRTVSLPVDPPTVTVEVDDQPSSIEAGVVTIKGALGSVHRVRLKQGEGDQSFEVAITDAGPSPARVRLDPAKIAGKGAIPAGSAAPKATGAPSAKPRSKEMSRTFD